MQIPRLQYVFWVSLTILFAKVFVSILCGYIDYFPANFKSNFLLGREEYFFGVYQIAFYTHLFFGPASLLFGTVLFFSGLGFLKSKWIDHRRLGKIQFAVVMGGVVPSGIIMAWPGFIGWPLAAGLLALAVATALTMWMAAVRARQFNYQSHRTWATRCYLLLISPLVLRIVNGALEFYELQTLWILSLNGWITWVIPLIVFEYLRLTPAASSPRHYHSRFLKGVS